MVFSRTLSWTAFAALLSLVTPADDPNSVCYSYGVDFVDEGSYFINSASTEAFTAVSTFKGCNDDTSDVLLVDPTGEEVLCGQISTVPADDNKVATCPITKNQMTSGHWILILIGNNGDEAQPFAWQRDLYLTVGTQITTTYTPTMTFLMTETPVSTVTTTSTFLDVSSVGPLSTVTLPSATAKKIKTVTPKAVTTTSMKLQTKISKSYTKVHSTTTKTVTATCTTPAKNNKPDKPCHYSPTLIHPAALATPTSLPKLSRFIRKSDRVVDYEWARTRIEAAKQRRDAKAQRVGAGLQRRAPDVPTLTITGTEPVSATSTAFAQVVMTTESIVISSTTTTTLPAETVYKGILTSTTTLPTPTKTKVKITYTTTTTTIQYGATFTRVSTVTPTSVVSACKKKGGHFW